MDGGSPPWSCYRGSGGKRRQPDIMFSRALRSHGGPREKPHYPDLRKRMEWELSPSSLGWMGGGGWG